MTLPMPPGVSITRCGIASPEMWPRSSCMSAMPVSTDVRRCEVPAATSPWKR